MMYVKPWIKDIVRMGGQQGRRDFLRLDMNENPGGLPEAFVEEVKKELTPGYLAMYPEESRMMSLLSAYLTEDAKVPVAEANLCLTSGSDMGIRYLYEVFAERGSSVVTVAPSFEMYRIYSQVFDLNHCPVICHEDYQISPEEILEAIQEDTDIVVLLNPNNPIGASFTEADFDRIAERALHVGAIVIVDEAYHYFYKHTFIKKTMEQPHVVVLRTFSKLMSLAGCRMGYIVGSAELMEYIRHVRPSFEVNAVALKFGEKLLEQPQMIAKLMQEADEGKEYLLKSLKNKGYETIEQDGNFIFVRPRHQTAKVIAERLEEKKVLVKTYGTPLLKDLLRISTGGRVYMDRFLQVFYEVDCP